MQVFLFRPNDQSARIQVQKSEKTHLHPLSNKLLGLMYSVQTPHARVVD